MKVVVQSMRSHSGEPLCYTNISVVYEKCEEHNEQPGGWSYCGSSCRYKPPQHLGIVNIIDKCKKCFRDLHWCMKYRKSQHPVQIHHPVSELVKHIMHLKEYEVPQSIPSLKEMAARSICIASAVSQE